ncbi:hypothetical protein [Amycolatopsis sp. NPDC051071]|uniref:hypothetical protein n=1 Tax=Amycolatopsis sp. NPDC051071 TaxID=3154637 RepID=UPI00343550AF
MSATLPGGTDNKHPDHPRVVLPGPPDTGQHPLALGGAKVQLPPDWVGDGRQCRLLPFPARSMVNRTAERQWGYAGRDCVGGDRTILQYRGGAERSILIQSYLHT